MNRLLLSFVSCAFLMLSCDWNFSGKKDVATDTIHYSNSTKAFQIDLKADYPVKGDKALIDSILQFINTELGGTYKGDLHQGDSLLAYYARGWEKEMTQMYDAVVEARGSNQDMAPMYHSVNIQLAHNTPLYITYTIYEETYSGGAHGMHGSKGVTIRKSDGHIFGNDILIKNRDREFNNLIKDGLFRYFSEQDMPLSSDIDLASALQTDDIQNIPLPHAPLYFTPSGIVMEYQPYEIACYAAGSPSFTIPYHRIAPYLTEEAKQMIDIR
ncbi:MAG: DUF3298 domain-containing protein [Prevotella sp.]